MRRGTCRRVEPLLALAAGDDLSATRAAFVEKHLRSCGPCRRAAKDLADTVHTIRTLPALPFTAEETAELRRGVWSRLGAKPEARRTPAFGGLRIGGRWTAAAAWAGAAGLLALALLLPSRTRPAPPEPLRAAAAASATAAPPASPGPREISPPAEPAADRAPRMARRRAPRSLHPIPNSTEPVRIELYTADPDVRIVWLVGSPLENLPSPPDDSPTTKEDPE